MDDVAQTLTRTLIRHEHKSSLDKFEALIYQYSDQENSDSKFLIPVNLLQPLVYTCSMKFVMAWQYSHVVSVLILHKAYIASVKKQKDYQS